MELHDPAVPFLGIHKECFLDFSQAPLSPLSLYLSTGLTGPALTTCDKIPVRSVKSPYQDSLSSSISHQILHPLSSILHQPGLPSVKKPVKMVGPEFSPYLRHFILGNIHPLAIGSHLFMMFLFN